MKPSIYQVACDTDGSLFVMPKPSGEWLEEDISHYKITGVRKIISLLTVQEAAELELSDEDEICARYGVNFLQHPIEDRGLPAMREFSTLIENTFVDLTNGIGVAVHCRAGIGRSGMLAACVLQRSGCTFDDAIQSVTDARGIPIPDTAEQLNFVRSYCRG